MNIIRLLVLTFFAAFLGGLLFGNPTADPSIRTELEVRRTNNQMNGRTLLFKTNAQTLVSENDLQKVRLCRRHINSFLPIAVIDRNNKPLPAPVKYKPLSLLLTGMSFRL